MLSFWSWNHLKETHSVKADDTCQAQESGEPPSETGNECCEGPCSSQADDGTGSDLLTGEILANVPLKSLSSFDLQNAGVMITAFQALSSHYSECSTIGDTERSSFEASSWEPSCDLPEYPQFRVGQYNLLAGYLCSNMQPWFLYPIKDSQWEANIGRKEWEGAGIKVAGRRATWDLFPSMQMNSGDEATASQGLDGERQDVRKEMLRRYSMRNADGTLVYPSGWPSVAEGLLSADEIRQVEDCNERLFRWERRVGRLQEVIVKMGADVISLVELDHYHDWANPDMDALGYSSVFRKRPRMQSKDGCGIFWRRSKFELVAQDSTDFTDIFVENKATREREPRRDRCAILALLRLIETGDKILVVSTHLARNPECPQQDALRAKQVSQLLVWLVNFECRYPEARGVPIVLAGDLNANNFERLWATAGALVIGMTSKRCPLDDPSRTPGSLPQHSVRFSEDRINQMLIGWSDVKTGLTSITNTREVRIDALMYKPRQLEVLEIMPQPMVDGPIPDGIHPSDHLPIAATFRLRRPEETSMRRSHSAGVDLMFKAMHQAEASGTSNLSSYSSESKLNDLAHGDVDHHLHNIRTG